MENFDTFLQLLKEEVGSSDIWDIEDVVPVNQNQDKDGNDGEGNGEPGEPGDDQEGSGEGEGQDGDQEGSDKGKPSNKDGKSNKGKEVDIGDTLKDIAEGKGDKVNDSLDDHSIMEKGDNTISDIVKKVWKEVEGEYRKREMQQGGSGAGSGLLTKVKEFLKEDLDISKIIKRISKFKREIGENQKQIETYDAALFGPVPHQTDIMMKGGITSDERDESSAVLFFAADTSGSITKQDYESIFGYINEIARKFKEKEYGVAGEVYLIEWGSNVERMRKWDYVKNINAPDVDSTLADGGGTDVQNVFNYLNKNFVEKDDDGNYYFVLSDNMKAIQQPKKKREGDTGKAIRAKLKREKKSKKLDTLDTETTTKVKEGATNITEGKFGVAPYLIFYTDGFFSPPANLGPLFKENPGNVLYIVTSKEGIRNIRPKNFVYHDLHGDDL